VQGGHDRISDLGGMPGLDDHHRPAAGIACFPARSDSGLPRADCLRQLLRF
jgi:hypothetical protein